MDSIIEKVAASVSRQKKSICIICEENDAVYCIKGLPKDCYCRECAEDNFGDVSVLEKL
jgi:hypothetical protein